MKIALKLDSRLSGRWFAGQATGVDCIGDSDLAWKFKIKILKLAESKQVAWTTNQTLIRVPFRAIERL